MATVSATVTIVGPGDARVALWEALNTTDTAGEWIALPAHSDRTVHAYGTWNTGTLGIKGSNEATPSDANAFDVQDLVTGAAIALTANGAAVMKESPVWVKPSLAGAGTDDVDVAINFS